MLTPRTDLALEALAHYAQAAPLSPRKTQLPSGVRSREKQIDGITVTTVEILTQEGANALGKPVGSYVTVDLGAVSRREEEAFSRAVYALSTAIGELLQLKEGESVLVVGLGNRAITPDAIGPDAVGYTLVTRHLVEHEPVHFGHFRPVSAITTGVLGTTGMESGELVKAVVDKLKPSRVVAIDALASRSMDRVCTTVQLSDTGIVPGSGVGNHRYPLNEETLGVPVIALGVPTVVDGATLALDILAEAGKADLDPVALGGVGADLMVTPRDIDQRVADMTKVIGYALDLALQPGLTVEDLELLLA